MDEDTADLASLLRVGLSIRRIGQIPRQRFVVIDGGEVCLGVLHPLAEEELIAVVNLRDAMIAGQLEETFDDLWTQAHSVESDTIQS